jgi:hypothetical protein
MRTDLALEILPLVQRIDKNPHLSTMLTIQKVTISALIAASAVSIALNSPIRPACAATVAYSGDTTGGSLWKPPSNLADIPYNVQNFTVDTNGTYDFISIVPAPVWLRGLYLYEGTFNPATPTANLVFGEGRLQSNFTFSQSLSSTSNYFLVTSGFATFAGLNNFGPYNNSISGPGNITDPGLNPTAAAVPEPFTILGSLVGGSAALRMRRKFLQDSNNTLD